MADRGKQLDMTIEEADAVVATLSVSRLKYLSYREREIFKLRYRLGGGYRCTLEEIGHIFRVTRERIRGIESHAIDKLIAALNDEERVLFTEALSVINPRRKRRLIAGIEK